MLAEYYIDAYLNSNKSYPSEMTLSELVGYYRFKFPHAAVDKLQFDMSHMEVSKVMGVRAIPILSAICDDVEV